jgi:hypothetical protein
MLARRVKVKALESHVNFGRFSVPRLAFYASIFSAVAVLYAVFDGGSVYGVAVPAAAAAVRWAEATKVWKFSLVASKREKESVLPLLAPGLIALAVFAAGAVFLFQYVPQSSFEEPQQAIQPIESRSTIEESVEMSRQKVAAAGGAGWPEFATAMPFGAAAVGAFLAYILFRYRSEAGGVLPPEQGSGMACGTQDYPERAL